jgi:putative peptide zinc metalloprotease protein
MATVASGLGEELGVGSRGEGGSTAFPSDAARRPPTASAGTARENQSTKLALSGSTEPAADGSDLPAEVPRLAPGTSLYGPYQGSGYADNRYLIGRADGRMLLVSPVVYTVASCIDGQRPLAAIAEQVSESLGRRLDPANLELLIESKLRPLGVVATDGATERSASPLLSLGLRCTLFPERVVQLIAPVLSPLFNPIAVAILLAATAVVNVLMFARFSLLGAVLTVMTSPRLLATAFVLTLVAILFHELGHAAACHYGGGRPGRIGMGIYLLAPAFFTNVNDSYRLSRAARIRTDLGGVYFNCVFATVIGIVGLWRHSILLVAVLALVELNILQQLLPLVRLDGYFVLTDLVGVPDLFGATIPWRRRLVHRKRARHSRGLRTAASGQLRRNVRLLVGGWKAVVYPVLIAVLGLFLVKFPAFVRTSWRAGRVDVLAARADIVHHNVLDLGIVGVSLVLLAVPYAGMTLFALRSLFIAGSKVVKKQRGRAPAHQPSPVGAP